MADQVNMGVLKPEYIQRAASLGNQLANATQGSDKAVAMAKHPGFTAPRRKEFLQQASQHTDKAFAVGNQIMGLGIQPAGSFTGRQANFQQAAQAANN